jgi:hypothetical protein
MKEIEMPSQKTEVPLIEKSEAGKGKELETSLEILEDFPKKVGGTTSTKLGSPITKASYSQTDSTRPNILG